MEHLKRRRDETTTNYLKRPLLVRQVLIPLANANEEMEVLMIVDALRRAKADVVVASAEDKLEIAARYGMRILTDMSLDDAAAEQHFDLIIVPASPPTTASFVRMRIN